MIPEETLMMALTEEESFLENLVQNYYRQSNQVVIQKESRFASELEHWLIRSGISSDCHLAQNRIGLYTDFT